MRFGMSLPMKPTTITKATPMPNMASVLIRQHPYA